MQIQASQVRILLGVPKRRNTETLQKVESRYFSILQPIDFVKV